MNTQVILRIAAARAHAETGTGRSIREKSRLSLSQVAKAISVPKATLSRWETGDRRPSGEPAARWAQLLEELEKAF